MEEHLTAHKIMRNHFCVGKSCKEHNFHMYLFSSEILFRIKMFWRSSYVQRCYFFPIFPLSQSYSRVHNKYYAEQLMNGFSIH